MSEETKPATTVEEALALGKEPMSQKSLSQKLHDDIRRYNDGNGGMSRQDLVNEILVMLSQHQETPVVLVGKRDLNITCHPECAAHKLRLARSVMTELKRYEHESRNSKGSVTLHMKEKQVGRLKELSDA